MYSGNYSRKKSKKHGHKRITAILLTMVILIAVGIAGTIAYLQTSSADVINEFTPGFVPPEIEEIKPEDNENVKKNVSVKNGGNVSAYVRAAIVATWQNDQGNVAPEVPVLGEDYSMTLASDTNWSGKQGDGYYYYKLPVAAGSSTGILIDAAEPLTEYEGYHLVIEILAQTIQSEGVASNGEKPVYQAWKVFVNDDGSLQLQ